MRRSSRCARPRAAELLRAPLCLADALARSIASLAMVDGSFAAPSFATGSFGDRFSAPDSSVTPSHRAFGNFENGAHE